MFLVDNQKSGFKIFSPFEKKKSVGAARALFFFGGGGFALA